MSIDKTLEHFLITAKETLDGRPDPKAMTEAKQQLKQLILSALPEKRQTEADKLRQAGHRIVGSSPYVDADNSAYNQALEEVTKALTALFEEEQSK